MGQDDRDLVECVQKAAEGGAAVVDICGGWSGDSRKM